MFPSLARAEGYTAITCFSWLQLTSIVPLSSTAAADPVYWAAHQESVRVLILFWKAEISRGGMQGGSLRWAGTQKPQMMWQIDFLNTYDILNAKPQYFIFPLLRNRGMIMIVLLTIGPLSFPWHYWFVVPWYFYIKYFLRNYSMNIWYITYWL